MKSRSVRNHYPGLINSDKTNAIHAFYMVCALAKSGHVQIENCCVSTPNSTIGCHDGGEPFLAKLISTS